MESTVCTDAAAPVKQRTALSRLLEHIGLPIDRVALETGLTWPTIRDQVESRVRQMRVPSAEKFARWLLQRGFLPMNESLHHSTSRVLRLSRLESPSIKHALRVAKEVL